MRLERCAENSQSSTRWPDEWSNSYANGVDAGTGAIELLARQRARTTSRATCRGIRGAQLGEGYMGGANRAAHLRGSVIRPTTVLWRCEPYYINT